MGRLSHPMFLCIIGLILMVVAPVRAVTDEFIWRDRWNQMGVESKDGYIIGIYDSVWVLWWDTVKDSLKLDGKTSHLQSDLQTAHSCANGFTTIKSGVEFAAKTMSRKFDPQTPAASIIYEALIACDPGFKPARYQQINDFVWKDRWDQYINNDSQTGNTNLFSKFFIDGYVAGILDLIRNLDNAAKTQPVLQRDVIDAWGCGDKISKGKNTTIGHVVNVVDKTIRTDKGPTESMAMAIFDALRICRLN